MTDLDEEGNRERIKKFKSVRGKEKEKKKKKKGKERDSFLSISKRDKLLIHHGPFIARKIVRGIKSPSCRSTTFRELRRKDLSLFLSQIEKVGSSAEEN